MKTALISLALLGLLTHATPVAAQRILLLPTGGSAADITPDGAIVVGTYGGGSFLWRWREDPAPTLIPGGFMSGISDDGSVACGDIYDPMIGSNVAAIWTQATGWQTIGFIPGSSTGCGGGLSAAYDISGDGTTIVGLSWGPNCSGLGFKWTAATGMQPLQSLANGHNRCSTISGDGLSLGGFAQGTFGRTPAYWNPNTSGAVLDANLEGEVYGLSENGNLSVGTLYFTGGLFSAFVRNKLTGVTKDLGKLHSSGWAAAATDISEDGKVIVGFDYISLARQAWVKSSNDGIISMDAKLLALGITGAPKLLVCRACSDDGNVVVGTAQGDPLNPFSTKGFIVEFNSPDPQWADLGNGLAGTNGIPSLDGNGSLVAGSATSVVLAQAKPGSLAAFVIGLTSLYAPFKQGVLVPFPNYLVTIPAVAPSGSIALAFTWPAGVPGGISLYWQCLVSDPAALAGVAISNALQSTTP